MDLLTSSAVSTINWLAPSSRDGGTRVPLAKTSLQYVTRLYNYWQSSSRRNRAEESYPLDEICYFIALPVSYLSSRSSSYNAPTNVKPYARYGEGGDFDLTSNQIPHTGAEICDQIAYLSPHAEVGTRRNCAIQY